MNNNKQQKIKENITSKMFEQIFQNLIDFANEKQGCAVKLKKEDIETYFKLWTRWSTHNKEKLSEAAKLIFSTDLNDGPTNESTNLH